MHNLLLLLVGEYKRMLEYKIAAASIVVALIWIGVLYLTEITDITFIFPLLLFIDTTSMAILMVGVTIFFEKQEGSLRAILVAPINKTDYLLTKIISTITASIFTLIILYLYSLLFKEMNLSIFGLLGAVIITALFHALVGIILSYYSKDFTGLLMNMFKYMLIFMLPALLDQVNIIQHELLNKILYLSPTKAAMVLLYAPTGSASSGELIYSLGYLVFGSVILFIFVIKLFDSFAAREGGV
ncbi:MAG: ABC transporter permease [Bacillota bacterium]|nr:ABC transporter permease [Bacillota bacterium]